MQRPIGTETNPRVTQHIETVFSFAMYSGLLVVVFILYKSNLAMLLL